MDAKTRKELIALARLSGAHETAIMNLGDFHVPLTRTSAEPRAEGAPFFDDAALARNKKMAKEGRKLCRYITKAEEIVKNAIDDTLSEEAYPWARQPPAKGSAAAAAARMDTRTMAPVVAMHGAHGEVVNKYTAAALQAAPVEGPGAKSKATKRSKILKDGAGSGSSAGPIGAGGGGGGGGRGDDSPFSRYLEPIKARVYEGGRIIVFFVGGVTQVEMAALDRLSKESKREIIVGGTSILTARDFLEQAEMTDPDAGQEDDERGLGAGVGDLMKGAGVEDF